MDEVAILNSDTSIELSKIDSDQFAISLVEAARKVKTPDEARALVSKLKVLDKVAKAADELRAERKRIMRLEAWCYIELVKSNFAGMIPVQYRAQMKELAELSLKDQAEIINSDDFELVSASKAAHERRHDRDWSHSQAINAVNAYKCDALTKFDKNGITSIKFADLSNKIIECEGDLPTPMIDDAIDGLRSTLLRMGAIGIGDGVYVDPKTADRGEIMRSIDIRLQSIACDISKLSDLLAVVSKEHSIVLETNNSNYGFLHLFNWIYLACASIEPGIRLEFRTPKEECAVLCTIVRTFQDSMCRSSDTYTGIACEKIADYLFNARQRLGFLNGYSIDENALHIEPIEQPESGV